MLEKEILESLRKGMTKFVSTCPEGTCWEADGKLYVAARGRGETTKKLYVITVEVRARGGRK